MTAMLKQLQANPPPAQVKAVEEICVTCGGAHPYYQCLAAGGNTFLEFRDNIQGYVSAATGNYNQGNPGYRPQGVANQMRPPGFVQPNVQNNQNRFGQPQGFNRGINFNQEQPYKATAQSNQNFHLNELEKIKRMNDVSMKAMQNQIDMMNTASTSGSGSLLGNTVANPKGELKAITTRSGLVTNGPTVPTPPKFVTPEEDECVEETYTDPDLAEYTIKVPPPPVQKHKPPFQRNFILHTRDSLLSNIPYPSRMLKKQQEKDEIQIQKFWHMFKQLYLNITLAEALVLMPKYQKMLKALLFNKEKLQELANTPLNENCLAAGKFIFPADFVVVDYESDLRVPLILGRPFLRTTRALIDVHDEEMILRDRDERLTLNMKHDTASYSNHPHRESANLINIFNISSEDCLEVSVSNPGSGNPTFLLHKEITSPEVTHEIHDSEGCKGSGLNDSIDQTDLANLDHYFVDPTPEMFNDEHAPDYSFPLRFDVYDDDFLEVESDANNFYGDPFDSKGEKIKEDDDLPSPDNEDKVFNPGILIQEKLVTIITRVAQEKKLTTSYASLVFEDFDPPFYEPLVFKDVPNSMRLLPFSFENKEKVFKPGIYTFEKVHSCFLLELSQPGYHVFKVNQIFISLMRIFHVQSGKNTPLLDVLLFHFYPP
nr:hypothetical protein [Tanacetum cinerariifolium]